MSETAEATGWTGAEQMEVLTFELNGELFALEAVAVRASTAYCSNTRSHKMTFTSPVSSSSVMNVTPDAVDGR